MGEERRGGRQRCGHLAGSRPTLGGSALWVTGAAACPQTQRTSPASPTPSVSSRGPGPCLAQAGAHLWATALRVVNAAGMNGCVPGSTETELNPAQWSGRVLEAALAETSALSRHQPGYRGQEGAPRKQGGGARHQALQELPFSPSPPPEVQMGKRLPQAVCTRTSMRLVTQWGPLPAQRQPGSRCNREAVWGGTLGNVTVCSGSCGYKWPGQC